jgi:hypothetical protein
MFDGMHEVSEGKTKKFALLYLMKCPFLAD